MPLFHVTPRPLEDDQVVRVRDPATGQLVPPQGVTVEWSTYWQRRLEDEEISKSAPPADADEDGSEPPPPSKASRRSASTPAPAASAENKD